MAKPSEIVKVYPKLFHMASEGSWKSIEKIGLCSTSLLCDIVGLNGAQRDEVLYQIRKKSIQLNGPMGQKFIVRDQLPMSEKSLIKALEDMSIPEWLDTLNTKVFFWPTAERLIRMMSARPYRDKRHDVLVIDTDALLKNENAHVWISTLNSGATIPWCRKRGSVTFQKLDDFDLAQRIRTSGKKNAIAEIALDKPVQLKKYIIDVKTLKLDGLKEYLKSIG